jgi:hypothetical protein
MILRRRLRLFAHRLRRGARETRVENPRNLLGLRRHEGLERSHRGGGGGGGGSGGAGGGGGGTPRGRHGARVYRYKLNLKAKA